MANASDSMPSRVKPGFLAKRFSTAFALLWPTCISALLKSPAHGLITKTPLGQDRSKKSPCQSGFCISSFRLKAYSGRKVQQEVWRGRYWDCSVRIRTQRRKCRQRAKFGVRSAKCRIGTARSAFSIGVDWLSFECRALGFKMSKRTISERYGRVEDDNLYVLVTRGRRLA